jgi:hypothetical protein
MPPTPSPDPMLIRIVEGESSFWGSPFWNGFLPILAVLLGAVVAHGLTRLQERQKAKQALSTHFIDQVVEYSTRLTRKTEEFLRRGHELLTHLEYEEHARQRKREQLQVDEIRDFLDTALDEIVEDHSRLGLIAPSHIRDGSRAVGITAAGIVVKDDLDAEFLRASLVHVDKILATFKEDVRNFVGVTESGEKRPSRSV